MNRILGHLALLLVCLTVALGCSNVGGTNGNPIFPASGGDLTDGAIRAGQRQMHLWGYWDVYIDVEKQAVEATLNRSAMFTANVVTFLNNPVTNLKFKIYGTPVTADYVDVDIDVTIVHPFPGLHQYDGYDVRGVFMGVGSQTMSYGDNLQYAAYDADQTMYDFNDKDTLPYTDPYGDDLVGMPDGYTRWFNASEFTFKGLFGYTQGKLATPNYQSMLTATLNPYKYFADGLGPQDDLWTWLNANADSNGAFTAGISNTRNYYLRFPTANGVKYGYAVVASWKGEAPEDHPANAPEAAACAVTITPDIYYEDPTHKGGDLIMDIDLWGWDYQPSTIFVESTVLSAVHEFDASEMTPVGGDDNFSTYHAEIPADSVEGLEGNEFWVIAEYGDLDYTCDFAPPGGAPEAPLAAFFRYDLEVLPESPCPDPTVTGIDPDYVLADLQLDDVTITGTALVDGTSLAVKLAKTGQSDIVGTDVTYVDDTTITADFDLTGAAEGFWDVVVTNGCGKEANGPGLFEIYSCGTLQGFTQNYHAVIIYNYPNDMPTYFTGVAGTQTGTPYAISAGNRNDNLLGAIPTSTMNGGPPQYYSDPTGMGNINRDVVCDSQNNVYFTDSSNYSRLRYSHFDASTGFGAVVDFGTITSGWNIWRITIDENDNPVALAYSGSNMRVFHWNDGTSGWDTTDVPTSVTGGNYGNVGDFDWNPLQKHYVFTRFVSSAQCNLYAIDQAGNLVKSLDNIFQGQNCAGLPGIYIDVTDPGCHIVTWGSHPSYGTAAGPFTRMTAAYSGLVKTSIQVGNYTGPNLNIASPRGQVAKGSGQLCLSAHYINVYAKVPVPSDW